MEAATISHMDGDLKAFRDVQSIPSDLLCNQQLFRLIRTRTPRLMRATWPCSFAACVGAWARSGCLAADRDCHEATSFEGCVDGHISPLPHPAFDPPAYMACDRGAWAPRAQGMQANEAKRPEEPRSALAPRAAISLSMHTFRNAPPRRRRAIVRSPRF